MYDALFTQILLIILLIIAQVRPFFLDKKFDNLQKDTLACIPFILVVISIINILVLGLKTSSLWLLFISIYTFFINFKHFVSLCFQLNRTYFSIIFKILSLVGLCFTLCYLIVFIIFFPIVNFADFKAYKSIKKDYIYYEGTSLTGFEKTSNIFSKNLVKITQYYLKSPTFAESTNVVSTYPKATFTEIPNTETVFHKLADADGVAGTNKNTLQIDTKKELNQCDTIVIIPNVYVQMRDYDRICVELALKGYKVIIADIKNNENKYFSNLYDNLVAKSYYFRKKLAKDKDYSKNNHKKMLKIKTAEVQNILEIIQPTKKVFVVADGIMKEVWANLPNNYKKSVACVYLIDNEQNKIFDFDVGLGNLPLTDPLECKRLGINKTKEFLMPKIVASKATKMFENYLQ